VNKCVSKFRRKYPESQDLKSSGSEFPTVGPATEKATAFRDAAVNTWNRQLTTPGRS